MESTRGWRDEGPRCANWNLQLACQGLAWFICICLLALWVAVLSCFIVETAWQLLFLFWGHNAESSFFFCLTVKVISQFRALSPTWTSLINDGIWRQSQAARVRLQGSFSNGQVDFELIRRARDDVQSLVKKGWVAIINIHAVVTSSASPKDLFHERH